MSGIKDRPSYRNLSTTPSPYFSSNPITNYWNKYFRGKREIDESVDFKGYRRLAQATNGLFIVPKDSELPSIGKMSGFGSWETIMIVEDFNVGCGNNVYNWTLPV